MTQKVFNAAAAVALITLASAAPALAANCSNLSPKGKWLYEGRGGPCLLEVNKSGRFEKAVCGEVPTNTSGTIAITTQCDVRLRMTIGFHNDIWSRGFSIEGFVVTPSHLAGLIRWDMGDDNYATHSFQLYRKIQ